MNRKRSVIIGAIIGLVVGIIMVGLGFTVPPSSFLYSILSIIHRPLVPLITWMHIASHGVGLYKALAVVLLYWGLIGFSTGVVFWYVGTRNSANK